MDLRSTATGMGILMRTSPIFRMSKLFKIVRTCAVLIAIVFRLHMEGVEAQTGLDCAADCQRQSTAWPRPFMMKLPSGISISKSKTTIRTIACFFPIAKLRFFVRRKEDACALVTNLRMDVPHLPGVHLMIAMQQHMRGRQLQHHQRHAPAQLETRQATRAVKSLSWHLTLSMMQVRPTLVQTQCEILVLWLLGAILATSCSPRMLLLTLTLQAVWQPSTLICMSSNCPMMKLYSFAEQFMGHR
mmetsp:Transcript_32823/g.74350  ORF Transcript_32823/g.74350 Transcript_32823/m.74350 type:complete len:244 (+) Transcript_32823:1383-2114(+)